MTSPNRPGARTGRGAVSNPAGRFESTRSEAVDDGWGSLDEELPPLATIVQPEPARSIISRNDSPDISFDQSINPYRGCEHGCVYCYARPSHAYLNLSPGLDFETRLFYKQDAARLLEQELAAPSYRCSPITIGANTDPYQPIEREYRVTRSIIEVLAKYRHPFSIITKSAMIERDIDLLAPLAADGLVYVMVSVTTLSNELKRTLEPRTASPAARLRAIRNLHEAGVPVGVMVAPVIPVLTDHEMERILAAAVASGAQSAAYVSVEIALRVEGSVPRMAADERTAESEARDVASAGDARRQGQRRALRRASARRGRIRSSAVAAASLQRALVSGSRSASGSRTMLTLFRPPVFGPEQLSLL